MAAYHRVYDSHNPQADCQELGSAPEPYALAMMTSMGYLFHITALIEETEQKRTYQV